MTPRPQPTAVLVARLRRVARWLDNDAAHRFDPEEHAAQRARANTCWQAAGRLEALTETETALTELKAIVTRRTNQPTKGA